MSNARNLSKFKPSSSGLVETADIADDAVSTDQIANNAVINTSGAITTTCAFTSVGIDDNADANAITIDSSERVGIANTSPLVKLDVTGSNSPPPTSGTSQTGSLRLGQTGGNGVVDMGFDTTNTQGWIQATNKANLATNYTLNLNPNGGDVYIGDGNLVVASGHGIDFAFTGNSSGSMSSELFDDYEEGTWTASQSVGGNSSISASEAQYVKVGRMVYISVAISFSGNDVDRVSIAGLPFTATNTSAMATFFASNAFSDFKLLVSGTTMIGSNTTGDASYTEVNGMTARFSGTYMATA